MSSPGLLRQVVFALMALCLGLAAVCAPGCKPRQAKEPARPPIKAPDRAVVQDPVQRGKMVFAGTEYSTTGLTCTHCHSVSAAMETGKLFIAHSAYGAQARGAWWIMDQAQFDAKQGEALTLADAANKCISAPYMQGKQPLSAEDAKALEAFYASIADPGAKDSAPFIHARPPALPPAGLQPDKVNGKRIFENGCSTCHGAISGIPDLRTVKSGLNAVQLMAKLRGQPDWETGHAAATYTLRHWPFMRLARAFGMAPAYAQEPGAGMPPEAGAPPAAGAEPGAEAGAADGGIFPENAMPYFAADILSDQDVVDVVFYVKEDI